MRFFQVRRCKGFLNNILQPFSSRARWIKARLKDFRRRLRDSHIQKLKQNIIDVHDKLYQ